MRYFTPLRYPGGKSKLAPFFQRLVSTSGLLDGVYVEPYAGGAAVAMELLVKEYVAEVHVNDASRSIYAFWSTVLDHTAEMLRFIERVPLTMTEWERQREVISEPDRRDITELGLATFYLNRTNRSGIIASGGVIGGKEQHGKWGIGARFNRQGLSERVRLLARFRNRIHLHNRDALALLDELSPSLPKKSIVYLDPPYFHQADRLYERWYAEDDHAEVASRVKRLHTPWVVTYDDCEEIRRLYADVPQVQYGLRYTAAKRYKGGEVLFHSPALTLPSGDIVVSKDRRSRPGASSLS